MTTKNFTSEIDNYIVSNMKAGKKQVEIRRELLALYDFYVCPVLMSKHCKELNISSGKHTTKKNFTPEIDAYIADSLKHRLTKTEIINGLKDRFDFSVSSVVLYKHYKSMGIKKFPRKSPMYK